MALKLASAKVRPEPRLTLTLRHPSAHLAPTIAVTPRLAAALLRGKLSSGAALRVAPALRVTAAPDRRSTGGLDAAPALTVTMHVDKRASAAARTAAQLTVAAHRLPASQEVLLSFQLDRTTIPYTAERR